MTRRSYEVSRIPKKASSLRSTGGGGGEERSLSVSQKEKGKGGSVRNGKLEKENKVWQEIVYEGTKRGNTLEKK